MTPTVVAFVAVVCMVLIIADVVNMVVLVCVVMMGASNVVVKDDLSAVVDFDTVDVGDTVEGLALVDVNTDV